MKISLNEIKKYVDIPDSISTEKLLQLIGTRLVEVEGVEDLAPKYAGAVVVKVVECEKIPETHLSLCQIDAGGSEKIQVVCGAPNVHQGMLAVWLQPGAIVPSTYGNEDFKLGVRKLRDYESNGMLAAADELALGDDHDGIIEISPKDAKPGDKFAEVFGLNDLILDIENKSLTHRPDTFGLIGFAREVAGILGIKFETPEFFFKETVFPEGFLELDKEKNLQSKNCPIEIEVKNNELCPRYTGAVINYKNANTSEKYLTTMQVFLEKAGMRSVSKIVDITNYFMILTGQPLHAFDYDKFLAVGNSKTPKIIVRTAKNGEELKLLDGKVIECDENDILITSNNVPVALAGAMGGKNTEIDDSTTRIFLESATFSLYHLRKTQMKHGIFSEAITRFTKGQPAGQTFNVLAEAMKMIGGEALALRDYFPNPTPSPVVKITTKEINSLLGTDYDLETIVKTLENVGFVVEQKVTTVASGDKRLPAETVLNVQAPFWRTDIHIKEDIIEEVGRLLGYDNIELDLPTRKFIGVKPNAMLSLKSRTRNILSDQLSGHEILTYSFISEKLLERVEADPKNSYKIVNSISPELQCFRQQIVPSLLDKVRENIKSGHKDFMLYELNQVFRKDDGFTDENVPVPHNQLGIVVLGDFYKVKDIFTSLWPEKEITYSKFDDKNAPYLEPAHSANLYINDELVGSFGEIKNSVLKNFKLKQPISALEINMDAVLNAKEISKSKNTISRFPSVERDVTLKVPVEFEFSRAKDAIISTLDQCDVIYKFEPVSIYQSSETSKSKNLSFHLKFASAIKTLSAAEISDIMEKVNNTIKTLGAEVI